MQMANAELIDLYWRIGEYLGGQIEKARWGARVVQQLAAYIKQQAPQLKGFSEKNLWRMKQFYETYPDLPKLSALLRELSWTNNLIILSRCKTLDDEVVEYALSRSVSPTVIADYETKLLPKELLKRKLHEFLALEEEPRNRQRLS